MTPNRNSKKWKELYNSKLMFLVDSQGTEKLENYLETTETAVHDFNQPIYENKTVNWLWLFNREEKVIVGYETIPKIIERWAVRKVDAMPDHIKEAEEYADKLYSAMR